MSWHILWPSRPEIKCVDTFLAAWWDAYLWLLMFYFELYLNKWSMLKQQKLCFNNTKEHSLCHCTKQCRLYSYPISSLDMYLVDIYCSPVTPWQWLMHCLTWHLVAQDTGLEGRICKGRRGNEANHNKGEIVDFSYCLSLLSITGWLTAACRYLYLLSIDILLLLDNKS